MAKKDYVRKTMNLSQDAAAMLVRLARFWGLDETSALERLIRTRHAEEQENIQKWIELARLSENDLPQILNTGHARGQTE